MCATAARRLLRLLCLVSAPLLVSAAPRPLQPETPGVVSTYRPVLTPAPDDEDGGSTDTVAGICLPICYHPNVSKDWSTKCHWMERCKDCKECTGDGLPSQVMARLGSRKGDGNHGDEPCGPHPKRKECHPDNVALKSKDALERKDNAGIWDDVWHVSTKAWEPWQPPKKETPAPLTPAQQKDKEEKEEASERDDLPCDDGPYILDLCDCGEGLGSSFNFHKTALTYATALRAKYIDLPRLRGAKIESAEPLPKAPYVDRANAARTAIFDGHDRLFYSPFFGLGSERCNAASLKAHRAAATGNLTFVDADQKQIEPTDKQSRVSNVNWLCARMESELDPPSVLFDTDPTLSNVHTALGGHSLEKLGKLVLVFDYEFNHPDLGFCAISPEFRKRWRKVQGLEARPRSLVNVPPSERVIAVHFRWGDTATANVNAPNSVGHRTVPLRELAKVVTTQRRVLGGAEVRVLLFTEASDEDRAQGRSDAEVVAEFEDFTKAVPNTELRLGTSVWKEGGAQNISTSRDLIDMAQADMLIGGSSSFFELAAHLSEAAVFTSEPGASSWATAAGAPHWAQSWGEQPNVTKRVSRWGQHIGLVGFDSSAPEVVYDGAWWDAHIGHKFIDTETEADTDTDTDTGPKQLGADAGICLPICYSERPVPWSTKCQWAERCKDCEECTRDRRTA